jgi:hypothetical protein
MTPAPSRESLQQRIYLNGLPRSAPRFQACGPPHAPCGRSHITKTSHAIPLPAPTRLAPWAPPNMVPSASPPGLTILGLP